MLGNIAVTVIKLGINPDRDDFMSQLGIYLSLGTVVFLTICYLFKWQVAQRYQAEVVLSQQTKRERVVNQIAQHIRQSLNLEKVLVTTVSEVREFLDCDRVLIYRIWEDGTGSAITEKVLERYPSILGETFSEEVFPGEYHQAYIWGKVRAITNIDQADVESCLAEFVKQFQVKAKLVVPIIQEIRNQEEGSREISNSSSEATPSPYLWGLLIAHQCSQPRQWQALEIDLVKQLATQVAIAIQQSELYEQLQQLNAQLEYRVQQRTEELALTNDSLRAEIVERQRTEAALRHTNQTLQSLIAASPRAIFTLNLQNRIEIWNPAAERMFGWTATEILEHLNPAIFLGSMEGYEKIEQSVLQGITPPSLEVRWQKKDGSPIDIVFSSAPLTDRDGKINGLVAVVADITEQKRQAEQVRLLQSVVVNTNDAIIITEANPIDEPEACILYVNQAFTRLTGYTLEEVLGKTPRILQGAKTCPTELEKVRSALSRRESIIVEVINYRKDGSEFWSEFSVVPVADKNGRYTHWISVQRDITERKHTEEALRRSEERFRSLIENALDIITILGADGIIYYGSPSVEKVLGYNTTELIGRNFFEYIHPEDLANCRNITNVIQIPELTRPIEFRCRHKDGSWCSLEAIGQKFVDDAAESRIVINSRDITERKRLDEVRLALEKEKELSVLKIRFFSMASHEFRTPLSTVLAAAQLLENSPLENAEKRLRNLRRIQESVKNMVQLLDDILTINRAETGKLEFNPKPLDLEQFCRQFVEEMQLSAGNQHTLTFVCQGESIDAYLDEKLLRSILANFLSNAIKYSPKGGQIHCSLKFERDYASLQIRDRGIGISPEDQKQLFEPFYRGKNVRHISGTGLGLVVVKKCVDLHGGKIEITSNLGQGTTATITLPLT
ncbi:multi-sensor signal transduction histidine kinase [Calothrix sp. NIES-4101]|nr:multi-sensor signal transduction histidine kinase [Calothrix sp. NIES-4101]